MAQYIIRKGKLKHEVTKFDDTDSPVDHYPFSSRGCTCPARARNCKHLKIVKQWEKLGKPIGSVFDDSALLIGNLFE